MNLAKEERGGGVQRKSTRGNTKHPPEPGENSRPNGPRRAEEGKRTQSRTPEAKEGESITTGTYKSPLARDLSLGSDRPRRLVEEEKRRVETLPGGRTNVGKRGVQPKSSTDRTGKTHRSTRRGGGGGVCWGGGWGGKGEGDAKKKVVRDALQHVTHAQGSSKHARCRVGRHEKSAYNPTKWAPKSPVPGNCPLPVQRN